MIGGFLQRIVVRLLEELRALGYEGASRRLPPVAYARGLGLESDQVDPVAYEVYRGPNNQFQFGQIPGILRP